MSKDENQIRNEMINNHFAGKTIERVDASAVNCWDFYFKDETKITLEVEAVFPSMGLYGITMYTGFSPTETIGPGCKPGDARKAIEC